MMYAAVLLAFVVVVTADVPKEDIAKMDDLDVLLNRLTARAQNLKDKIDGKLNNIAEADRKSKNMILRMDRMNVNDGSFKCPRGENGKQTMFKCGTGQQCIGNILVCDNVADCLDGSDEDPDYCTIPFSREQKWVTKVMFYHCSTTEGNADEINTRLYFQETTRNPLFPANVDVTVTIHWTVGTNEVRSFKASGKYWFATKEMKFAPFTFKGQLINTKYTFLPGENVFVLQDIITNLGEVCSQHVATADSQIYEDFNLETFLDF